MKTYILIAVLAALTVCNDGASVPNEVATFVEEVVEFPESVEEYVKDVEGPTGRQLRDDELILFYECVPFFYFTSANKPKVYFVKWSSLWHSLATVPSNIFAT